MPTPLKPCDGHFSVELQENLHKNIDRAQWATHACEVCGVEVGAIQVGGKWVPEAHWRSVKYPVRDKEKGKSSRISDVLRDEVVVSS
jgi:hypothetical protein